MTDCISQMLEYKESLGYSRHSYKPYLADFARYFDQSGYDEFTAETIMPWCAMRPLETPAGLKRRLLPLRELSKYLCATGEAEYVLPLTMLPIIHRELPYIFSDSDLIAFFNECDSVPYCKSSPYLSDIIGILAEQKRMGNPISMEQIELVVTNLYGGWDDFSEEAKQYIQQILSIADYQKAYETVRNSEIHTSISLVQFQEAYPGILSQDNLHSVIENVVQRKEKRSSVLQQLQELKASEEKSKKKNTKAQDR